MILLNKKRDAAIEAAYEAGKDKSLNGANTVNCHFKHFATPDHTNAWEQGVADGEKERQRKMGLTSN